MYLRVFVFIRNVLSDLCIIFSQIFWVRIVMFVLRKTAGSRLLLVLVVFLSSMYCMKFVRKCNNVMSVLQSRHLWV